MNTRLKYIGALVIVALLGVVVYQAYWLEQLHFTIGEQMDNDIREAMRVADLKEVFLRLKSIEEGGPHGVMDVSAGIEEDGFGTAEEHAVGTEHQLEDGKSVAHPYDRQVALLALHPAFADIFHGRVCASDSWNSQRNAG